MRAEQVVPASEHHTEVRVVVIALDGVVHAVRLRRYQDVAQNTTRFLVLGREAMSRSGADKTSLVFALPERAGALHAALTLFARQRINLTMIQSRPQRERPWAYVFFVDLQGHREDAAVRRALAALEKRALFLKVLGSYPEGKSA